MAYDPVCGMKVDAWKTDLRSDYNNALFYFCSYECKKKFDSEPRKFAKPGKGPGYKEPKTSL